MKKNEYEISVVMDLFEGEESKSTFPEVIKRIPKPTAEMILGKQWKLALDLVQASIRSGLFKDPLFVARGGQAVFIRESEIEERYPDGTFRGGVSAYNLSDADQYPLVHAFYNYLENEWTKFKQT